MNIVDCIQGDAAWFKNRLGCVTSSRVADVIAKRKRGGAELQCRVDMRWELVIELLSNTPTYNYVSRWMKEGKEKEPLARAEYQYLNDVMTDEVGFVYHPTIKMCGCSPDGLVGDLGMVEFKCPMLHTHLEYLMNDVIPDEYMPQLLLQLACAPDREWIDFVSFYCPLPDIEPQYRVELPDYLKMFQKRLPRTAEVNDVIASMEREIEQFNVTVQEQLEAIKQRNQQALAEAIA